MTGRYQPYEPPSAGDGEPQWPLMPLDDEPAGPTNRWPSGPRRPPPPPRRGLHPVQVVVGIAAMFAIVAATYSASQEAEEPDYRDQWQDCLAEQQADGGLLEPEELCSIRFPEGEEDYGDLGYDNPDDPYDSYLEDLD